MPQSVSRYTISHSDETLYEPGSGKRVLRNLQGITSKREMDRIEHQELLRVQNEIVEQVQVDQVLTVQFIRELHRSMFGKIYSWAGSYRSVEISKGGFAWPPAKHIDQNMMQLSK